MKMLSNSRGQVFAADFLIAATVVILILGISLHASEVILRSAIQHSAQSANTPQAVSQAIVDSPPFYNLTYYCFNWNNGTANCTTPSFKLSCAGGIFQASRRLVNCTNSNNSNYCLLEVTTCG